MKYDKFCAAMSKVLAVVAVALILISVLAAGATAATYKVIHQFSGTDGADPEDALLIFDASGNLYGTTLSGGAYDNGAVFELTPNSDGTWTETVLYSFAGSGDVTTPMAGVVFDFSGNLYGTGLNGGTYGYGGVYELSPNNDTWSESVIYSFTGGSDGHRPVGGVILDSLGNVYGTANSAGASGNGVVFELSPNPDNTWTENVLYSFKGGKDGSDPDHGSLIFDAAGNLYGTAAGGGKGNCRWTITYRCGTVFELSPNPDQTWSETVLYRFAGKSDGATPQSTPIFDSADALYGTTMFGGGGPCSSGKGQAGCGTAFQLVPKPGGGWTEHVLYRFRPQGGTTPWGGLVLDASGNLYGTAVTRGSGSCNSWWGKGCGTVYKLVPNSKGGWTEQVLHRFSGSPGGNPYGSIVFDGNGNIYGVASGEGTPGSSGLVYEITP